MNMQRSRLALGMSAIAALALLPGMCWAIFYGLGPSKDEWGLKYNVEVTDAGGDMLTVRFILADEGRLKPIHSISLSALQKENISQGTKTYEKLGRFDLQRTDEGTRVGEMKLRKDQAENASMQVLTQRVDGKYQSQGAAYYDIPLKRFLNKDGASSTPVASSPSSKNTK